MSITPTLDTMATALVPSLSRSLAEQFNVFRVMHHGTHEKQLSNVFAWLLRSDATHELGTTFQRIFLDHVNRGRSADSQLPIDGYEVTQEIDTTGHDESGMDIADIVLTRSDARVVIENFGTSDGHGHDYVRYLRYGSADNRRAAVVLLCVTHEPHLQTAGWQDAVVTTYADLLHDLKLALAGDRTWRGSHRQQAFFLDQLFHHFLEGPSAMSVEDRLAFIKSMCDTGESARYGHRPQDVAAQEFANQVAQHAKHQFEEGRKTLAAVKKSLKGYATQTLAGQVNAVLGNSGITSVEAKFVGKWEWCVTLKGVELPRVIFLEFGPTAATENGRAPDPLTNPDYTKVFVARGAAEGGGIDRIAPTGVGMDEVLAGLSADDTRLRDAVLAILHSD